MVLFAIKLYLTVYLFLYFFNLIETDNIDELELIEDLEKLEDERKIRNKVKPNTPKLNRKINIKYSRYINFKISFENNLTIINTKLLIKIEAYFEKMK